MNVKVLTQRKLKSIYLSNLLQVCNTEGLHQSFLSENYEKFFRNPLSNCLLTRKTKRPCHFVLFFVFCLFFFVFLDCFVKLEQVVSQIMFQPKAFAHSKTYKQLLSFVLAGHWHITGKTPISTK